MGCSRRLAGTDCRVTIRISPIPSGPCGGTRTTMPRRNALPIIDELCTIRDFDLGSDTSVWLCSFATNSRGFFSGLRFSGIHRLPQIKDDSHVRKTTSDSPSSRRHACLLRPWAHVNCAIYRSCSGRDESQEAPIVFRSLKPSPNVQVLSIIVHVFRASRSMTGRQYARLRTLSPHRSRTRALFFV